MIEQRIADNRAQTVADSVMYREALVTVAEARGRSVHWYNRECVCRDAAVALGCEDIDAGCMQWADPSGRPGRAALSCGARRSPSSRSAAFAASMVA